MFGKKLAYPLNNEPENLMIWKKNIFYNRLFVIFNGNLEEIHCSQHFLFQIPYFGFSELNLDHVQYENRKIKKHIHVTRTHALG